MTIDDGTLMAYADAQLDAAARLEVERAIAADPAVSARVQRFQRLSGRVQAAYDGVLAEPVPDRLLRALQAPSQQAAATPAPAPAAPARERSRPRTSWLGQQSAKLLADWAWPQWSAAAASLAIAAVIGALAAHQGAGSLMQLDSGRLLARGALERALATQAAGPQVVAAPAADSRLAAGVQMNLSFRNRGGEYCRAFNVSGAQPKAGVACHRGDDWQIDVLTPGAPGEGSGYRQAGSALPAAVLSAVEQQISGEPLDAAAEAQALKSGWR